MQINFPATSAQRKAGMAAFRAQALKASIKALALPNLKARDAETIRQQIETIKAAQQRLGEI